MNKNFYTYCYFGNMPGLSNVLKEQGVDINERNASGQTGLEIACGSKRVDAVKFLLLNGADPTLKNEAGVSVMDKLGEYDDSIQSLLKRFANGEFKDEMKGANAETSKAVLIKKKIKAKVESDRGVKNGVTQKEADEHNEKIQRVIDSLVGKMSEDEVIELIVGPMVSCMYPLLVIRADAETPSGRNVLKQVKKNYNEIKTFNDFCNDLTDLILKMDIDEERLDDLIDVIDIRSKQFHAASSPKDVNSLALKLARMMGLDVADMLANGEIELPHKE